MASSSKYQSQEGVNVDVKVLFLSDIHLRHGNSSHVVFCQTAELSSPDARLTEAPRGRERVEGTRPSAGVPVERINAKLRLRNISLSGGISSQPSLPAVLLFLMLLPFQTQLLLLPPASRPLTSPGQ